MNLTRRTATVGGLSLLGTTSLSTLARADWGELNLSEGLEDFWLATDAYIYGYPLVTVEMTRRVATNVAKLEATRGPMGQLIKFREYPNASYRDVTAPNADTLYVSAFFDVGNEPWVLSIPDMKDRYFLFPMLDGWFPSTRQTHNRHGRADLCDHPHGLEWDAANGRQAT